MQSEHSSSLKAGSTKTKNAAKGAIGTNIRYFISLYSKKGFSRIKAPMSGTKTSQSEVDTNLVIVDGKVKTPKEYTTKFI